MEDISIRSLQHYLYCPHRWGLIEIDRAWAENFFVVKANATHERVHSGEHYSLRGKKVFTDVDVWSEKLGLYGKTDCIELRQDRLCIVEYKPTKPKEEIIRHEDAMQLFAQKLCTEECFQKGCTAEIYYADIKKRFPISFDPSFQAELTELLQEMRNHIAQGQIPKIRKGQQCSGCSMKDLCMPQITKRRKTETVKTAIMKECAL